MNKKHNLLYLIIFIITLFGCGSDMNTASNDTGDTGSAVFSLKWESPQNSNNMSLRAMSLSKGEAISELSYAPQIDCSVLGVLTVTANVYDSSNTYLINGGPWNCSDHSGTITNVPVGDSRKLTIYGKDSSDRIIYRGQVTGVAITANQTTNAGSVTMSTVASDTTAPIDGSLSATAGNTQVSLSWSNFSDSGGIDYYKIVYSTSSTPSSCSAGTQIYLGLSTSYTHTGLTNGTTYYYRVCAIDNAGNISSGRTTYVTPSSSGGTTTTGSAPSAPTGVSATAGNGQVSISWTSVSGATSYNIYMATQSGVTKSNYTTLSDGMKHTGVTSSYTHTGLTNGTTYYFVVTAVNSYGESSESSQVSAASPYYIDSYTKLMLHADGSDGGATFTDSETTPKTVTNTETYDSYTKLMLHMEGSGNSFTDSAASKAVTANGDATQTTAQFKLGSKSAVFDGTGDYLSLADSDDWNFGSGDWTVDAWVYVTTYPANPSVIYSQHADANNFIRIQATGDTTGKHGMMIYNSGAGNYVTLNSTTPVGQNGWHHLAFIRNGNNLYLYQDGVQVATTPFTQTMVNFTAPAEIGGESSYSYWMNGSIDELRISKGVARWTANFTPPSSPYGKVYTVTGTKKFGAASGEFKGSGEYLSLADSDDWNFGSGDFTIDTWVKFNPGTDGYRHTIVGQWGAPKGWWFFYDMSPTATIYFGFSTDGTSQSFMTAPFTATAGTWYHMTAVRSGNNGYFFVNGVQVGSTYNFTGVTITNSSETLNVGAHSGGTSNLLNGYLDELRISKGIARWTSNFTPPTSAYE